MNELNSKLNNQQMDLVAKNYNLIYLCINDLKAYPREDYTGIASIGLCKAAMSYDNNKDVKFANYATRCIKNQIVKEFRDLNRKKIICLSYEQDIGEVESYNHNYEDEVILKLNIEELKDKLGDKKIILDMIIDGYTQMQIAKKTGYSQSNIYKISNYIKKYLKNKK